MPTTARHVQEHDRSPADDTRRRLLAGLPVTERRVQLAAIPTVVLEGGDGPPLVLLHSSAEFAAIWLRVVPDLVGGHRVIIPDLPGHGASAAPAEPLGADRMLAWLGELLEATCQAPPVLVGRGLGGALAARFAAGHGDRLDQLVLVGAFGMGPFDPAPAFGQAMQQFGQEPTEATRDVLFRQCFTDLDSLATKLGPRWTALADYALDRARGPDMAAALGGLMPELVLPAIPAADLDRIAVPTSLIWGRQDRQVPLAVAEAAAARHGWPLQVIDPAGDDPPMEQPAAFLAALETALTAGTTPGRAGR